MAKKSTPSVKNVVSKSAAKAAATKEPVSTPVRNSAIPKGIDAVAAPAARSITAEMIAVRAFEIHAGGTGGSSEDNWFRAERELRGL